MFSMCNSNLSGPTYFNPVIKTRKPFFWSMALLTKNSVSFKAFNLTIVSWLWIYAHNLISYHDYKREVYQSLTWSLIPRFWSDSADRCFVFVCILVTCPAEGAHVSQINAELLKLPGQPRNLPRKCHNVTEKWWKEVLKEVVKTLSWRSKRE